MNLAAYLEIVADQRLRLAKLPPGVVEFILEGYLCEPRDIVGSDGEIFRQWFLFAAPHSPARIEAGIVVREPSARFKGKKIWWRYGKVHRDGAPAVIELPGFMHCHWLTMGNTTRSVTTTNGSERWYRNGVLMPDPNERPIDVYPTAYQPCGARPTDGWGYEDW